MSEGKSILIDVSRCTGCRGCQVACKQWNNLPGTKTKQTGSYQNPPDMNAFTYKVVRFHDGKHDNGKVYWNFFTDMCRHCINPPCLAGAEDDNMYHDEATGAVVYTANNTSSDFELVHSLCPYDIPRLNEETKQISKCTMCVDRLHEGMKPACVHSCPTDCMVYGEREEILAEANKRLEILKKTYPDATLVDPDEVRVIFLITDKPENYSHNVFAL